MDETEEEQGKSVWESMMTDQRPARSKTWRTSVDVQQPGFSDTHATGNQQRLAADGHGERDETEAAVVHSDDDAGPTQKKGLRFWGVLKKTNSPEEVLSAEASGECFDEALATNAVPDTACRRTLIGAYTLGRLEEHLKKQGYQVKRVKGNLPSNLVMRGPLFLEKLLFYLLAWGENGF